MVSISNNGHMIIFISLLCLSLMIVAVSSAVGSVILRGVFPKTYEKLTGDKSLCGITIHPKSSIVDQFLVIIDQLQHKSSQYILNR